MLKESKIVTMDDDRQKTIWKGDAETLAKIGQSLQGQLLKLQVRLPATLAAEAVAAWERDDLGVPSDETPDERLVRGRAAALALIGLAVQVCGRSAADEVVQVELDAWFIGNALDAADDLGLLNEPPGPPTSSPG